VAIAPGFFTIRVVNGWATRAGVTVYFCGSGVPVHDDLFRRSSMLSSRVFGLRGAAAVVAATCSLLSGACGGPAQAPEPAPVTATTPLLKNPIALQLWSVRELFKAEGVPATLAKVKAMGISHVEMAGTADLPRAQFKAELDKAGLTPISMHIDIEALLREPARFIDDAKFFGVQYVGNAWFPHEAPFDAIDANRAVAAFNEAGRLLREAGLTFFYHVHGFEFAPAGASAEGTLFDTIVARTDADNVKFQLDTLWAYHGGADPAALLRRYPNRFVSTHLKDMRPGTERNNTGSAPPDTSVALGTGEVDIRAVLEAARGTSVEWHIIEEESSTPEVNIPAGLAYIRQLEAGQ
jgi:sugar phosphate isomerase/epimerase